MPAALELWIFFIVGQLINILKRAGFAVRGPNAVASRKQYLLLNWDVLLVRGVVGAVIFWTWASYPNLLTQVAKHFGYDYNLTIPVVPPVAFGFGLALDVILDWFADKVPALKRELPALPNGNGKTSSTAAGK